MSKYIEADRIRAFLQKKLESYKSNMVDPTKFPIDHIDLMAFLAREYQALILQIESLLQEQPVEGLEEELENYAKLYPFEDAGSYRNLITLARHFAEWGAAHLKK